MRDMPPSLTTIIAYYIKRQKDLQMKKFILGIVIGVLVIILFTYLGGGAALQTLGKKTIEVGERVEVYEKALKDVTHQLLKKTKETKKDIQKKEIKK